MHKLNVIVPATGQREWVVSYFENNGVNYFVPMENFITTAEAPEDFSEEQVGEIALILAQEIASQNGLIVDEFDEVYEFIHEGTFLGWTVDFWQTEWDN